LLEYKKFKDAAQSLEERAADWQERYPRLADDRPTSGRDASADRIKEVELWDLVSALSRIIRTKTVEKEGHIRYEETPISVYIERVSAQVRKEGRVSFASFFEGEKRRARIVGVFLAILELLRHHGFRAEQPVDFEDIWVLPPVDEVSSE
jgi:segregation and condensation protein A